MIRAGWRAALLVFLLVGAACSSGSRYRYLPHLTAPGADLGAALSIASGFQPVGGNSVTILENGDAVFPSMLDAIRAAKSSIHFEMYIFRDGEIGRQFVEALDERARSGVQVRLLLDALGSSGFGDENEKMLEQDGAHVEFFHPVRASQLGKVHLRTHRKVLIVDGRVGFTGGICIDDAWQGNAERSDRWRETQVRVEGPVVGQMQVAFARAWAEATGELLSDWALFTSDPAGSMACQVMDSIPGSSQNPARLSFLIAAASARRTIDITNAYFVPNHDARDALRDAAKRGVRVRLILPGRNTDIKAIRYAGRRYYEELLKASVEIYEYQPALLHSKTIIVDGAWASVGSANLDRRSFSWNYESNLNIFDEGFARQMEEMFDRDLAKSTRVMLEEWKHRPLGEKFLESFYGIFRWQY